MDKKWKYWFCRGSGGKFYLGNRARIIRSIAGSGSKPITEGLYYWLDGRDAGGTDALWIDRTSGKTVNVKGLTYTETNGWTGTGVKLGGLGYLELLNAVTCENSFTIEFEYSGLQTTSTYSIVNLMGYPEPFDFVVVVNNDQLSWKASNMFEPKVGGYTTVAWGVKAKRNFQFVHDAVLKTFTIYTEGIKVYTHTYTSIAITGSKTLKFGGYGHSANTGGGLYTLNSVKIYNRALTADELKVNVEYEKTIIRS